MGCLVQSVLAVEDNVPNGLEGFLTGEVHLEGSKRRAKTPATKKKKKTPATENDKSFGEARPPFSLPLATQVDAGLGAPGSAAHVDGQPVLEESQLPAWRQSH